MKICESRSAQDQKNNEKKEFTVHTKPSREEGNTCQV